MRILAVHPGASWATADVYNGITKALKAQGHDVRPYALGYWIDIAGCYLLTAYEQARRDGLDVPVPTDADKLYWASKDILINALRINPDWVLIVSGMYIHPDVLPWLRRCGFKTAILFTESPYDDGPQIRLAKYADVCFTNERGSVPFLSNLCERTYYLPHAYDPDLHKPGPGTATAHDVVMVGTGFMERVETLTGVDWTGIDLGLYGTWSLIPDGSPLLRAVRGGNMDNARAVELYRSAKIGLNIYRSSVGYGKDNPRVKGAESLNPRMLELAACGVFQLSDYRPEVAEVFGDAVPTFANASELEWLTRYYLEHDKERRQMAAEARERLLTQPRTYTDIAAQLAKHLEA